MKKTIVTLVILIAVFTTGNSQEIKTTIHPDGLAQFQENPKEYLVNWEEQKLISYEFTDSKQTAEATLKLIFFTPKGQWQTVTSEPFKLFPGTILFPGNIFFPGNILEKMPKGKGLILFDLQVNNYEALITLKEMPCKTMITFTN